MADEPDGTVFIIGLVITTLIIGGFVLIVKSDYRIDQNAVTNEEYYPQVRLQDQQESR